MCTDLHFKVPGHVVSVGHRVHTGVVVSLYQTTWPAAEVACCGHGSLTFDLEYKCFLRAVFLYLLLF